MTNPYPLFPQLQQMIIDLALIDRKHYLAKTNRRENDIEHTMAVALLCWYIHDKYKLDLDIAKILKYAITHDFVERYAGDTNTYANTEERAKKIEREQESLDRLSDEFDDFPDMIGSMKNYEAKQDDESLFVWTVDKMQALIMGDLDNWRPYAEISTTYDRFIAKNDEVLAKSSKHIYQIYEGLIEYSKSTYYDKP